MRWTVHGERVLYDSEWVSLRLDGELSELEEAMLRRHVAGCGDCQAFAATAESFTSLLRSAPLEPSAPFSRPRS